MAKLKVVVPEATENLCVNPSLEKDLTSWSSSGAITLTRSTEWQAYGAWSAKGVATAAGIILAPLVAGAVNEPMRITARVKIDDGSWIARFDDAVWPNLGPGIHLIRLDYTFLTAVSHRLQLESSGAGGTAYIDGVQYEQKDRYHTTYCDGDQEGCSWVGPVHSSRSIRTGRTRRGGREQDLRSDLGMISLQTLMGFGMPGLNHLTQSSGLADGEIFQGVKADPALLTIRGALKESSLTELIARHRGLVDVFKPDRVPGQQDVIMIYDGSGEEREIDVQYLQGLEGSLRPSDNYIDLDLQFVGYEPRWRSRLHRGTILTHFDSVVRTGRLLVFEDEQWKSLGTFNRDVDSIARAPDGTLYIGGFFTEVDGISANHIAKWDPITRTWSSLGTGISSSIAGVTQTVRNMAIAANGDLYIAGVFNEVDSVAGTRGIARWDGSAWHSVGGGLGSYDVDPIVIDPVTGDVWVGGGFTTAGSGVTTRRIAHWDGVSWTEPDGGFDGSVSALEFGPDQNLYIGGFFGTNAAGTETRGGTAIWTRSTEQITQVGDGLNFGINVLRFSPSGTLYAGGPFDTNKDGSRPIVGVARLEGSLWQAVGGGLDDAADYLRDIQFDGEGNMYVGGRFSSIGGLAVADDFARWNGSAWTHVPFDLPGVGADVRNLYVAADFFAIGHNKGGIALTEGITVITNEGSSEAYPVMRLTGPAHLRSIRNLTTGEEMLFDYHLQLGEQLTLDLRPNQKTFQSNIQGNVAREIFPGSDFGSFRLVPGENKIAVLMVANYPYTVVKQAAFGSDSSVDLTKPDEVQENDYLHVALLVDGGSGTTITPPSGWTLVRRIDNGTDFSLVIYEKIATASEPSTWTWTLGSAQKHQMDLLVIRRVNPADPIDVENGQTTASANEHLTPNITTTVDNALVIAHWAIEGAHTSQELLETVDMAAQISQGGTTGAGTAGLAILGADVLQLEAGAVGQREAYLLDRGLNAPGTTFIMALNPDPNLALESPEVVIWWQERHWGAV